MARQKERQRDGKKETEKDREIKKRDQWTWHQNHLLY